jgi:AbrB family looped-hinge helix DNA binding protein
MTVELRSKSQITVPREVVSQLELSEGDKLEVQIKDGMICLVPVAVYPKSYVAALERAAADTAEAYKRGEITAFSEPNDLLSMLHKEVGDDV